MIKSHKLLMALALLVVGVESCSDDEGANGNTSTTGSSSSSSSASGACGLLDQPCCDNDACSENLACDNGHCTCVAPKPDHCNGVCMNLATDDDNCGMCGNVCTQDQANHCAAGTCQSFTWARWPMPNPEGGGLPNPSSYVIDAAKGIVVDQVTKLMWQRDSGPGLYNGTNARHHCADLVHGGYDDWRLPTRIELLSIVDFTKLSPTIDTNAFPGTTAEPFWTASPRAGWEGTWYVDFANGRVLSDLGNVLHRVRCVR